MTKTDHIQKLLDFISTNLTHKAKKFVAPRPLPRELHDKLIKRVVKIALLYDRDVLEISFDPQRPLVISVFTALESHHNGSLYDEHTEQVPVFDEFLDFAISVLRNQVHNIVLGQLEAEEKQRKELRVHARMKELGL
jgi:hypothetical protein